MEFKLEISRDNVNYYEVDLFSEQRLEYDLDFYDSFEIDKVKLPFYTTLRIPLTINNKASNRFNFEPISSLSGDFPRDDFYFKITIFGSSETEIAGILNVKSFEYNSSESYIEVELKDYISKYLAAIKDVPLGDLYTDNYYTTRHTISQFKQATAFGGEAGVLNSNPDPTRPISFPYVDFCNDVEGKFGYAARQFAEYGPSLERTGFTPVFSVPLFFQYLASYIESANFPLRIDSKLFALGAFASSPAFADFQPEKLHMVLPAQLLAKQDVNTRNFTVRQAPAWTGTNEALTSKTDLDKNQKLITTGWFGNMETAGNYGTDAEGNPLYDTLNWGAEKRMGFYPDDNNEGIRGFFCPKVSFNAGLSLQGGTGGITITDLKLEIPVVGEDKLVQRIYSLSASTTMRFKFYISIYENGLMVKKIPFQDSLGNDIILEPNDIANVVQGPSNKDDNGGTYDYFDTRDGDPSIIAPAAVFYDTLLFEPFQAYFPQDEELLVYGGSQYSVNYFVEPLDGELDVNVVDSYTGSNPHEANSFLQTTFGVEDVRKAITRLDGYGALNVIFTSNADTLVHLPSDEFIISDSINQTCPLSVSEILLSVLKRFDCGLFYEYDDSDPDPAEHTHVLRVDPLSIVRTGGQDINSLVDDLKSVKIDNGGDKVKTLEINNDDFGLYFDDLNNDKKTIGSTIQEINNEGIAEIKINLDSSIYYKSVCGDESDQSLYSANFGAFSEKELGFTPNVFTKNKDVGIRFAFLDKPLYRTNILTPHVKLKGDDTSGKMNTESQVIYINYSIGKHTFNGRLFNYNTAGWNLMFEDEQGDTTDSYDNLFAVSEKILQSENPRITFDMVVPTSDLASLDFFLQTLSATRFTANPILVKSAKGDVFDDYAYLTIEGILQ